MAECFELSWGSWLAEASMLGLFGEAMVMAAVVGGLAFAEGSGVLVAVDPDFSSASSLNSKSDCYLRARFNSS